MRSPKRGDRYIHPRLLESDYRTHATVEVTRVMRGCVYYQQVDRATGEVDGMKMCAERIDGWTLVEEDESTLRSDAKRREFDLREDRANERIRS